MLEEIYLHTPKISELWYRQKLLSDPDTMSFNRNSILSNVIYNYKIGCIDFPKENWKNWFDYWVNRMPIRYYAYVARSSDDEFVGEVYLYKNENIDPYEDQYEMGIIIENKYRCNGYGKQAIDLLLNVAFTEMGAFSVHNEFESYRTDVLSMHLCAGFKAVSEVNKICSVSITAAEFNRRK